MGERSFENSEKEVGMRRIIFVGIPSIVLIVCMMVIGIALVVVGVLLFAVMGLLECIVGLCEKSQCYREAL